MKNNYSIYIYLFTAFAIFMLLRLISFSNADVVDEHDSVSIMRTIEVLRSGNLHDIINMDPDRSLMFGFAGALINLGGWSLENSARLVSLFSSIGVFFICYQIGKYFYSRNASVAGLFLLSLSPALIALSFSVLTEPHYILWVYLGLMLFIIYHRDFKLLPSFFIGIVFGLSFLTRLEGILFLVFIPLMKAIYLYLENKFQTHVRKFAGWTSVFLSGFLLIAVIQVSWASYNMNTFALDGRQVWTYLLNKPGDATPAERIYGLDYSDRITNAVYLKQNPGELYTGARTDLRSLVTEYSQRIRININDLYRNSLPEMLGIVILIFFSLGIVKLYKAGRIFEIIFVLIFIATGLLAPILHNVVVRHILVIAPIIVVVAGIGLYSSMSYILFEMKIGKLYRYLLTALIFGLILSVWVTSLPAALNRPAVNSDYDPLALQKIAAKLKNESESERDIIFSAQKRYLQLYSDAQIFFAPFTDYEGLVNFLELNNVNYLFLNHYDVRNYPFLEQFLLEEYDSNFLLIKEMTDGNGQQLSLYKFLDLQENNRSF